MKRVISHAGEIRAQLHFLFPPSQFRFTEARILDQCKRQDLCQPSKPSKPDFLRLKTIFFSVMIKRQLKKKYILF